MQRRAILGLAPALAAALTAPAQTGEPQPPEAPTGIAQPAQAPTDPGGERSATLPELMDRIMTTADPRLRAGLRAHLLREAQLVRSVVVIAGSADEAAAAISAWKGLLRFPVLIDDGTVRAAEDIGRFVRAFAPASVLRWREPVEPMPADRDEAFARISAHLAATAGLTGDEATPAGFTAKARADGVAPLGVVAIDPADPAWIAGLALAAGRVQHLTMVPTPAGDADASVTPEAADAVEAVFRAACDEAGARWAEIGDEIDALTLCWNGPTKIAERDAEGKRTERALSDALGRVPGEPDRRWAYAGIVMGDPPRALYAAMCSMFLAGDDAWLFDGYPDEGVWKAFDATEAATALRAGAWRPTVTDTPTQSADDWRTRTRSGLSADLVLVNTKGNRDRFELAPGWALATDVPLLATPAAVHFVHSWSAARPLDRGSVAGRFLEHGAYAYAGSVFEPFLSAFVPTPALAQRLAAGVNFAAAVRLETGPPWRVNVFADPLLTLRRPAEAGRRGPAEGVPLTDPLSVSTEMKRALLSKSYAAGMRAAVLLGRDADAARLAEAMLRDQPEAFGNDVARESIMPLFREGKFALALEAARRASPDDLRGTLLGDAVWFAARSSPPQDAAAAAGVLQGLLREPHEVADALELAGWMRRAGPAADAAAFLKGVAGKARNDNERRQIEQAVTAYGG